MASVKRDENLKMMGVNEDESKVVDNTCSSACTIMWVYIQITSLSFQTLFWKLFSLSLRTRIVGIRGTTWKVYLNVDIEYENSTFTSIWYKLAYRDSKRSPRKIQLIRNLSTFRLRESFFQICFNSKRDSVTKCGQTFLYRNLKFLFNNSEHKIVGTHNLLVNFCKNFSYFCKIFLSDMINWYCIIINIWLYSIGLAVVV